jgi:hypothetical protein
MIVIGPPILPLRDRLAFAKNASKKSNPLRRSDEGQARREVSPAVTLQHLMLTGYGNPR